MREYRWRRESWNEYRFWQRRDDDRYYANRAYDRYLEVKLDERIRENEAQERKKRAAEREAKEREAEIRRREEAYAQLYKKAYAAYRAKNFESALRGFNRMLIARPDDPRPLYLKGKCFFELGRYDEAIAYFDKSLEQSRNWIFKGDWVRLSKEEYLHVHFFLGRTYRAKGNFSIAEVYFNEVLREKPRHPSAYYCRACCRMDSKNYEEAIKDFTVDLRINPKGCYSHYYRGLCHYNLGHHKEALGDFKQELLLNPEDYVARQMCGYCFERMQQYDQGICEFTEALKLRPQEAPLYTDRAFNHYMLKHWQEALADCNEAVRLDPESAHAYFLRGYVRAAIGDQKGELTDLTRYVQMRPNDGHALLQRGQLLIKMGDSAEGRRDLDRAIDLFTKKGDQERVRLARKALPSQPVYKGLKLAALEEVLNQVPFSLEPFQRPASIVPQIRNKAKGPALPEPNAELPDSLAKALLRAKHRQTFPMDWMQRSAAKESRDGIEGSAKWLIEPVNRPEDTTGDQETHQLLPLKPETDGAVPPIPRYRNVPRLKNQKE